jgi:flagellar hook-basal body complex protein FliE
MKEITFPKSFVTDPSITAGKKKGPEFKDQRFADFFWRSVAEVDNVQQQADGAIRELAAGRQKDLHQTMIAIEKAEISFQLLMKVRNKIIAAYEEIMRMSI